MSQHTMTSNTQPKMKQRNFCITSFDLSKYENWSKLDMTKNKIKYMVYQQEKCPKTGKEHIQGYVEFKNQHRNIKNIKEILNDKTLHIEARRGTATEARDYCMKAESRVRLPIELGEFTTGGRRTDIKQMYDALKEGKTPQQICEMYPSVYIKYYKAIDRVYNDIQSKTEGKYKDIEVSVLYGKAGSGKTRQVYDKHGIENVYRLCNSNSNNLWFDGYTGQKVLLIDDYYGWIKYGKFLQLIDNYKIRLEIKGGITYSQWDKVYITSNEHPKNWYKQGLTPALSRRLKYIDLVQIKEGQKVRKPIERTITMCEDGTQTVKIDNASNKVVELVLPTTYEADSVGPADTPSADMRNDNVAVEEISESAVTDYMKSVEEFRQRVLKICPDAFEICTRANQSDSDNEDCYQIEPERSDNEDY